MSVTYDAIADGMVAQIAATMAIPSNGGPTATNYVRRVKRLMSMKFSAQEFGRQGGSNSTPAVFVAFAGERPVKTTTSRRFDKVEATFRAICASDLHRDGNDRKVVLSTLADVRKNLGARKFGLAITPLRYAGVDVMVESDVVTAYAARFTTRYFVDYTIAPGNDIMTEASGSIVYPPDASLAGPPSPPPTLVLVGAAGTARVAYELQVLYGTNPRSDWSTWSVIESAAAVFDASHKVTVSWATVAGATGYRLRRILASNGLSLGVIYTGTALTFTDDGTVAGDGNITPERGLNLHEVFP